MNCDAPFEATNLVDVPRFAATVREHAQIVREGWEKQRPPVYAAIESPDHTFGGIHLAIIWRRLVSVSVGGGAAGRWIPCQFFAPVI